VGGNLDAKTPYSTEIFFNLLGFLRKNPKITHPPPLDFAVHKQKFQNTSLKKFMATPEY